MACSMRPHPHSVLERKDDTVISALLNGGRHRHSGGAAKGAPSEEAGREPMVRRQQARLDHLLEGMTPMEFILRYTFSHPEMDTNIVAPSTQYTCRTTSAPC